MSTTAPGFPTAIDSTMVLAYKACPRKFHNSYVLRRKPRGESIHLVAGGAFASGMEAARQTFYDRALRDEESWLGAGLTAIYKTHTIPDEDIPDAHRAKSADRVAEALVMYFDRWPMASDPLQPIMFQGRHGIEFSFALPIPVAHPETGEPLLYAGRCDMLAEFGGRGHFGVDEKTSKSLGPQWAQGFRLRGQFMGYAWAAREHGWPLSGVVVRGVGFLMGETRFEEAIIYTPDWKVDRWYEELLEWATQMCEDWRNGAWRHSYGDSCSSYGGCPFVEACDSRSPDRVLASEFEPNDWTPIRKIEMKLND